MEQEEEEECFTAPKPTYERNLVSPVKLDNTEEDSGFSSRAGSVAESAASISSESEKPASAVIDVQSNIFALLAEKKEEKRRKLEEEREKRRLVEEEYNREISELRYKRLMHLLDKSQFYANLILKKNDRSTKKRSTSITPKQKSPVQKMTKRKIVVPKENSPPAKRPRRNVRPREEHDLKDFVTSNFTSRLRNRKNLKKLSLQEDEEDDNLESSAKSTSEKVEDVSMNAAPEEDEEELEFTPSKYFVGELRDYQIEGLKWLRVLYENGLNGILADEMGLGKTIQVIALFCELMENRQSGPFLIVAPLSTIPNWLLEFERFAPNLPVVLFHGPPEERLATQRNIKQKYFIENGYKTQPIVLTTYEVSLSEKSFLKTQKWRYIVIDEGHRIKNYQCQLVNVLKVMKSMNRLLLTGTPLQNNLAELWSLLNFLLPDIFNDLAVFESWFDVKELQHEAGTMKFLQQEEEKKVVASLREILKPFMLRRVKTDVCLEIPPKKEIIVYAPLTELQRDLYKAVLNRDLQTLCKIEDGPVIVDVDGVRPKRKCVLKKSCDLLYSNALKSSTVNTLQNLVSSSATTSFSSNKSVEWKPNSDELKMLPSDIASSSNKKKNVWNDFFNLAEIMENKSNSDCEKLSTSSKVDPSIHKLMSNVQKPAPSCSSSVKSLNRIDEFGSKNSLVCNMTKMIVDDKRLDERSTSYFNLESLLCKENMGSESLTPGSSVTSTFTIEKNPPQKLKKGSKILSLSRESKAEYSKKGQSKVISTKSVKKSKKSLSLNNFKNAIDEKKSGKHSLVNDNVSLMSKESEEDFDGKDENVYPTDRQQSLLMWKQYTNVNERNHEFFIHLTFGTRLPMYKKIVNHPYLMHCPLDSCGLPTINEDLIKASGKLMVLDQMLAKLKERGHKILLFSTWTKILDILEDYLSMRSYLYVRLDGCSKIEQRKKNITIFNNDPNVFIFLISTRAGGLGLNLAGADTVIIYDSDWNPQADIQAMARCHRIGQVKPVVVYRFCTKGTIDEEIMKRADVKRKLEKMVISKKDIGFNLNNKENLLKLKQLLGSNDCQVVSSEKDVFPEEELEKLLDRSDLMQQTDRQMKNVLCTSKLENSQEG